MLRYVRNCRVYFSCLGGVAVLLFTVLAGPARAQPRSDPVLDLKDALYIPVSSFKDAKALAFRQDDLEKKVAALRTVGELRRALLLTSWKDTEDPRVYSALVKIDRAARARIASRLTAALQGATASPGAETRLAAASYIGELGVEIRAASADDHSGYARALAPELVKLTHDPDTRVRQAAARALGKINADHAVAVPALRGMLETDQSPQRRAAAEALGGLVRVAGQLERKGLTQAGVSTYPGEAVAAAAAVVPAAGLASKDEDPHVRRLGMEAMQEATVVLNQLIMRPYARTDLSPYPERMSIEIKRELPRVAANEALLRPLAEALAEQAKVIAARLTDEEPSLRLLSRDVLEHLGEARQRQRRLRVSLPGVAAEEPGKVSPLDRAIRPSLDQLAVLVSDPNPKVRLAAVQFLEMLDEGAAPAAAVLAKALEDESPFVRWAAARTLGHVAPLEAEVAAPALGKRMADPDLEVRLASAYALQRYGPAGAAATPNLIQATQTGDAEARVAAIQALTEVLGPDGQAAAVVLGEALSYPDVRVRRAAAEALGKIGPRALAAQEALRGALRDRDDETRRLVGEALLSISVPEAGKR